MHYHFEFLTPERAEAESGDTSHWYRVRNVLGLDEGTMPAFDYIAATGITQDLSRRALDTLDRLRRTVHESQSISYHEEEDQDIDRVLNIFIRVNSAGTVLSYSDLLLRLRRQSGRSATHARRSTSSLTRSMLMVRALGSARISA